MTQSQPSPSPTDPAGVPHADLVALADALHAADCECDTRAGHERETGVDYLLRAQAAFQAGWRPGWTGVVPLADDVLDVALARVPVEAKVRAATIAAAVSAVGGPLLLGVADWAGAHPEALLGLPGWAQWALVSVLVPAATLWRAYQAPHTPRALPALDAESGRPGQP